MAFPLRTSGTFLGRSLMLDPSVKPVYTQLLLSQVHTLSRSWSNQLQGSCSCLSPTPC